MRRAVLTAFLSLALAAPLCAEGFRALARIDPDVTVLHDRGQGAEITLGLSQAVPFRVTTHDAPWRLVIDFREVDFSSLPPAFGDVGPLGAVSTGAAPQPGWSRMVLELDVPMAVQTAAMQTDDETGAAQVLIALAPTSPEAFAEAAASEAQVTPPVPTADDRLVIVLDPGHGGVDPGAEADGEQEAALMLSFARELSERILRTGRAEVVMTRNADIFVSLPERVSIARAAGADAFISLHADALTEGQASGASVYTLSDRATDAATTALAERFDRADMVQGIDLGSADDTVATVLMEMARRDTAPRSDALAASIVDAIGAADLALLRNPQLEAGFAVLKAADIPSVLVEVGFMSNPEDLERLRDPEWRTTMQEALATAILAWAAEDQALAGLRLN